MIELLKCKLHGVKATGADKDYEGSILIDSAWMEMAGIHEYEKSMSGTEAMEPVISLMPLQRSLVAKLLSPTAQPHLWLTLAIS
ncbi:MAG: aspartate 1-decarboxylase [Bdellovibrionota bacterium]